MKNSKRIISLVLSVLMIFSFADLAGASASYSDDVLKTVFNATKLFGKEYSENEKITYGQLSKAATNLYTDEFESSYNGLNTESLFNHEFSRDFYAVARDVFTKYFSSDGESIVLQIDNPYMKINGVEKEIDPGIGTRPVIENSRTLLPVRAVVEEMGGTVGWDNDTREVTLSKGDNVILLTIDSKTAYLNENAVELDCEPVIKAGRTFLPIRFIAESFGYIVGWNNDAREVSIASAGVSKDQAAVLSGKIDKNATIGDSISVLTYYLEKRENNKLSLNKDEFLTATDKNAEITHKEFAQLLCELDDKVGLLLKVELTRNAQPKYTPVKINKNLSSYPENSGDYRVILEEISPSVYGNKLKVSGNQKAVDNYNFARDYKSVFTEVLQPWVDAAYSQANTDMKITYYPSLVTENGNGHTMRVKLDIISAKDNKIKVTDIFNTSDGSSPSIYFETGKSYYCDFANNTSSVAIAMNMENLASLSEYLTISAYYVN